ncbi:MAG: hypothetical protein KDG44_02280, partial [Burkholderiaceae bacterium]|nr:hypothetical protein [Burkholderiaceae bacterium]
RSAVGAVRRPRNHEPSAGTAWRDAQALNPLADTARRDTEAVQLEAHRRTAIKTSELPSTSQRFILRGSRQVRWSS